MNIYRKLLKFLFILSTIIKQGQSIFYVETIPGERILPRVAPAPGHKTYALCSLKKLNSRYSKIIVKKIN